MPQLGKDPLREDGPPPVGSAGRVRASDNAETLLALRTLAGGLVHAMNNALGPIVGHADLLLLNLEQESRHRGDAQAILDASERVRTLVSEVMLFSQRSSRGKGAVPLHDVVAQAVTANDPDLPHGVHVKLQIDPASPPVKLDRALLTNLVEKLLHNARQALGPGPGALTIECAPYELADASGVLASGSYVRLTVADTGCGIGPDVLPHVFEPFFTTRPRGEGLGLGLSIVQGVATGLGGDVLITSEPGSGTRVDVYFPAA